MDIEIISVGSNKVKAIKIVREATGWGLKETKDFVDSVDSGSQVLKGVSPEIIEQFCSIGVDYKEITVDDFSRAINGEITSDSINAENDNDEEVANKDIELSAPKTEKKTSESKYVPIFNSNMISKLDRENTMKVLVEVGKIAKESEEYDIEIAALAKKKNEENARAEELRKKVSKRAKTIIWGVTIAAFFIGLVGGPLCIVTGIVALIIMNLTVKKSDLKKHEKENNENAEQYIAENVLPLQEKLDEIYALRDEFTNCGKRDWALDIVGRDLFYSACVQDLYNLIKNRRADNLKEALNKYDDSEYKARMEEMQAAIQNASEITARESVKQTAYSQETAKNTHKAATAARQTAYNTRQIDKNTRRFR